MGAGPTQGQIRYHMNKAKKKAQEFTKSSGLSAIPRLIRASNGEAAIVFDVTYGNGTTKTQLNLNAGELTC